MTAIELPNLPTDPDLGDVEARERFTVDNDRIAAWAMEKLAEHRTAQATAQAVYNDKLARLTEWLHAEVGRHDHDVAFFEGHLTRYALHQRDQGRKSVILPDGSIRTTETRQRIDVSDKAAFETWAKASAMEGLLAVSYTPDKKVIAEALTVADGHVLWDGEIVPGLSVVLAGVSVKISAATS